MTRIIYVARDIERALGKEPVGDYFIVSNKNRYTETIQAKYPTNVFLVGDSENGELDTYDLLINPEVKEIINKIAEAAEPVTAAGPANIVVFKNTSMIEKACADNNWKLLNPSAALAEKIENKVTQVEWLGDLTKYLPRHEVKEASLIRWGEKEWFAEPFILQWAHSHTGEGTMLVRNNHELNQIKEKFPKRDARITEYIHGPMFTVNVCVLPPTPSKHLLIGNASYQITGMLPFTDNPMTTIGNDWCLPHSILSPEKVAKINAIAEAVGMRMQESGWVGLFGIDCIYDHMRDNVNLIEINARQPASTTYESELQSSFHEQFTKKRAGLCTIFECHINALEGSVHSDATLIEINDGAQIIQRVTRVPKENNRLIATSAFLHDQGLNVIEYQNLKPGNDLLRIQSHRGFMETHNKLNARGLKIIDILLA
jgi:hypothetical protein